MFEHHYRVVKDSDNKFFVEKENAVFGFFKPIRYGAYSSKEQAIEAAENLIQKQKKKKKSKTIVWESHPSRDL